MKYFDNIHKVNLKSAKEVPLGMITETLAEFPLCIAKLVLCLRKLHELQFAVTSINLLVSSFISGTTVKPYRPRVSTAKGIISYTLPRPLNFDNFTFSAASDCAQALLQNLKRRR